MSGRDRMVLVPNAPRLPERGASAAIPIPADLTRKPWLTTMEAAIYLSLPTVNALRRRVVRGSVPCWCWTKFGGSLRFSRVALDELLAGRATDARTMRAIARR